LGGNREESHAYSIELKIFKITPKGCFRESKKELLEKRKEGLSPLFLFLVTCEWPQSGLALKPHPCGPNWP
jgi:hypothetical protein